MLRWMPENVSTYGGDVDALFSLIYVIVRGIGGYAATHVEGTAEVLRLAEVFVTLALTSFMWAAQHFEFLGSCGGLRGDVHGLLKEIPRC